MYRRLIDEGYKAGLEAGQDRGFEEGFTLGVEEGGKLGTELGKAAGLLLNILSEGNSQVHNLEVVVKKKVSKTLQEILAISLDNGEDLDKEQRLNKVRAGIKELKSILGKGNLITLSALDYNPKNLQMKKSNIDF